MARRDLFFKIQDWKPDTLPMARLAEYLHQLALLLGSEKSVHFMAVGEGSAKCQMEVEESETERITERVRHAMKGVGNKEAISASNLLSSFLEEDQTGGDLEWDDGTVIAEFRVSGEDVQEPFGPFWQDGSLDGYLTKVGGYDDTVPVHLLIDGKHVICNSTQSIAKELGHHLYEHLRLFGRGRWYRNTDGMWELQKFNIVSFAVLNQDSLLDSVERLRLIPNDLVDSDDPIELMERIKHGRKQE